MTDNSDTLHRLEDRASKSSAQGLKILVVDALPPWYHGGIQKVIGETAKRLVAEHDASVEIRSGGSTSSASRVWNGIRVKTYQTRRWQGYASLAMLREIKSDSKRFDVVHAHGSGPIVPLIAALAKGNTPLVFSAHFHPQASSLVRVPAKWAYDHLCNAYIFQKASKVVCVSDTEKKCIEQRFKLPAGSMVTIPNGVDTARIARAKPYDIDYTLVASVGRLEKYKQNQLTIEALKHLPKHYRFLMIGKGPYRNTLEDMIRKNKLGDRAQVLDSCSDDQVYRWLRTCSVFVNLSEIEAFGISVLEALAAGKGVIVNDKLGLAELARKFTGAIFRTDPDLTDPVKLAELIEKVAAKRIDNVNLGEFQWPGIARRLLEVYEDVIKSQGEAL
jgi:glycosyltransferase involved in cell wall biosynthesis